MFYAFLLSEACVATKHSPDRVAHPGGHRNALRHRRRTAGRRGQQLRSLPGRGVRSCRGSARSSIRISNESSRSSPDLVIVYGSQTDLRRTRTREDSRLHLHPRRIAGHHDDDSGGRRTAGRGERPRRSPRHRRADRWHPARVGGRPKPRTCSCSAARRFALRGIYASGGIGFLHDMLEAAGGENVFADVKQQAVQATTELILARRPEVILELRGDIGIGRHAAREDAVWQALPRCRRSRTAASTSSTTSARSSRARASPKRSSSSPARFIPRPTQDEDSRVLEQRKGQRLDAARAAAARHRRAGGAADDGQRGGRPGGDACASGPTCCRRRPTPLASAHHGPHSVSVPERGLRGADAAAVASARSRGLHARRVRRSRFSKTSAATARSDWPAPA